MIAGRYDIRKSIYHHFISFHPERIVALDVIPLNLCPPPLPPAGCLSVTLVHLSMRSLVLFRTQSNNILIYYAPRLNELMAKVLADVDADVSVAGDEKKEDKDETIAEPKDAGAGSSA